MTPALIVHGGAWRIDPAEHAAHVSGVSQAAQIAWERLLAGDSALNAVEQAVMAMEDDPTFDAGRGSVLNCVGEIETDAMIMDGKTLHVGAVGAVQGVQYPIQLARLVMLESSHSLLVGRGAHDFARLKGVPFVPQAQLTVQREIERYREMQANPPSAIAESFTMPQSGGTVGAVAMDTQGNLAAATSTGGTPYSLPGRVGDSPLVGCGTYADNQTGAASATGHGERIMQVVLAKHATDLILTGIDAQTAANRAIDHLQRRVDGRGGLILIDREGRVGFAHNTPHMAAAWYTPAGELQAYIQP
ncbi:MAG: isoaspartyl peptidase/L-asparaginase family protein [Anaerolineales bacterium]